MSAALPLLADAPYWPFMAAAAVLTDFAADKLRPLGGGLPDVAMVGALLMEHGNPIRNGPAKGRWSLSATSRSAALAELNRHGLLSAALAANRDADRPDNPTQRALDLLLAGHAPAALSQGALAELLGLERAIELLRPCLDTPAATRAQVLARIERLRLLEPLQRLVAQGFAGRAGEQRQLREYVDELQSQTFKEMLARKLDNVLDIFRARPLLVIFGPGGTGKSTLIAKFLLDHAGPDTQNPVPFVYLDFDRAQLDPLEPDSLLTEALRQIEVQFPEFAGTAASLGADSQTRFRSVDTANVARSAHFAQSSRLRQRFARLVGEISAARNSTVLFFIDTFEVVQRRGSTHVYNVLALTAELAKSMPRLRPVIAGRAALRDSDFSNYADKIPRWKSVPLQGFDAAAGRLYLQGRLSTLGKAADPSALDRIVSLVRGNPLSLRLAAQVFAKDGVGALENAVSEAEFEASLAQERLQGMLHNRIVASLEERVRKIADPGLIVRRLTPEVIQHVLAGPCGLLIETAEDASQLFGSLETEVSLFEPLTLSVLRHRPDVRLLMLPLLRDKLGDQARAIDTAAVAFWSAKSDPEARAEALYHLLWLDADTPELEVAYNQGPVSKALLEDTLDEFEALKGSVAARFWLCGKLDREIPVDLESQADLSQWERNAARRAASLIESGSPEAALSALHARAGRTSSSPLWLLEIEALKLSGRDVEALTVTDRALELATGAHAPAHVLRLIMQRAWLFERLGRRQEAFDGAGRAVNLAAALRDDTLRFEAALTQARLARLLDSSQTDSLRRALVKQLDGAIVRDALARRPALSLEASAEVGDLRPELFIWSSASLASGGSDPNAEAASLISVGVAQAQRLDYSAAREALERARALAEQANNPGLRVRALVQLAGVKLNVGDQGGAFADAADALVLAQAGQDPISELRARELLGNVYTARRDLDAAAAEYEKSLGLARLHGDRLGEGNALGNLANVCLRRGDPLRAIELLQQDLVIAQALHDRHGERQTLANLAVAYGVSGDAGRALELYRRALALARELGDLRIQGFLLRNMAALCFGLATWTDAETYLGQALESDRRSGDVDAQIDTLGMLATVYRNVGDPQRAREVHDQQVALIEMADFPTGRRTVADPALQTEPLQPTPAPADAEPTPWVSPAESDPASSHPGHSDFEVETKWSQFAEIMGSVESARESNESLIHQTLPKQS